ncbi:hypothetical protein HHK36_015265 [Tetracentron sinense]|uniref:Uncharacterized protein n=1 Tax=Tetracentron sinense TaxID=13715 RepID=A0A834Z5U0_TETSI|nr:hypothetical protein HHK36_015265 [Tetracentron sinense]
MLFFLMFFNLLALYDMSGTIMTISKDRVKPSPLPDRWKLTEILTTGIILSSYLAMMTVIFFWVAYKTDFFPIATLIAVYANWGFAVIEGIGWGWAGVVWLYNIIFYIPLDFIKFFNRYALSRRAWDLVIKQRVAFTRKKDFRKEAHELKWAHAQRTLQGLQPPDTKMFGERTSFTDLNQMVEEAKRRAEIARCALILRTSFCLDNGTLWVLITSGAQLSMINGAGSREERSVAFTRQKDFGKEACELK